MTKETKSEEWSRAHDRLCQEVGQNVLRFQLLELLLKDLVAKSKIKITPSSVQQPKTDFQTLGGISTRFFEDIVSESEPVIADTLAKTPDETAIHIEFRIPFERKEKAEWMDRLGKLIKERNDLIHTSLKTMSLDNPESCQKEIEKLLDQRKRIQLEIDWLKSLNNGINKTLSDISDISFQVQIS